LNLGYIYRQRKDWKAAEAAYKKALELKPGYSEANAALLGVYQESGQADKVAELASSAGSDPKVQFNLAVSYLNSGKGEEALAAFQKASAADTSNPEPYFYMGTILVGQNKVPKAAALADLRPQGLRWHLVGHLQSNKAKKAAALFDWVHSLDGAPIARRLGQAAAAEDRKLSALVQVDLASEPTKSGLDEAQLFPTLESLRGLPAVSVLGLMALPPYEEEPERVRPYFRQLRVLRDRARQQGLLEGAELSMGMSHDLEVAVEEGATLVRVGTAIFGERHGLPSWAGPPRTGD